MIQLNANLICLGIHEIQGSSSNEAPNIICVALDQPALSPDSCSTLNDSL
jgi:hypothetical protein